MLCVRYVFNSADHPGVVARKRVSLQEPAPCFQAIIYIFWVMWAGPGNYAEQEAAAEIIIQLNITSG